MSCHTADPIKRAHRFFSASLMKQKPLIFVDYEDCDFPMDKGWIFVGFAFCGLSDDPIIFVYQIQEFIRRIGFVFHHSDRLYYNSLLDKSFVAGPFITVSIRRYFLSMYLNNRSFFRCGWFLQ